MGGIKFKNIYSTIIQMKNQFKIFIYRNKWEKEYFNQLKEKDKGDKKFNASINL